MSFKKVIMVHDQPEIAKVNRKTGVLYLNSNIWNKLPSDQKEFVLFHEEGHLKLQTADEFHANAYAIKRFIPAAQFNHQELGKRLYVMREILSKAGNNYAEESSFSLGNAVNGIVSSLQVLGVGSKARQNEAVKTAQANVAILGAQTELEAEKARQRNKAIIVAGVLLVVLVVTFLTLKKK